MQQGKPSFTIGFICPVVFGPAIMAAEGSVSRWLDPLKGGDAAAAQELWERYFHQLVRLARQRLQSAPPPAADEEDIALSAFASFCRGASAGRFPQLADRDDLWKILVVLTARKASHLLRDEGRLEGAAYLIDEAIQRKGSLLAVRPGGLAHGVFSFSQRPRIMRSLRSTVRVVQFTLAAIS